MTFLRRCLVALGIIIAAPVAWATIQGIDLSSSNTGLGGILPSTNGGTGMVGGSPFWTSPITSVNFGVAGDNAISIPIPTGYSQVQSVGIVITNCTAANNTGNFGVFTATGGGGTAVISAGTAGAVTATATNTAGNTQTANASGAISFTPIANTLWFRVGTTVAATCDVQASYRVIR